ncbi:MAG: hypothetical protein AAF420_07440, partial [Pseudomonadota bacterium]
FFGVRPSPKPFRFTKLKSTMATIKTTDLFVDILIKEKVQWVFGIPGGKCRHCGSCLASN